MNSKNGASGDNPKKREPGTGKGQIIYVAEDFDKPLDDFEKITKEISATKSELIRWIVGTTIVSTATIAILIIWILG
ncbi:MAG: hypothetical protein PHD01_04515 [Geobacteraceae bacterium]|nr:hypothetical protein [Geobacteraceae bacterium]